MCHFIKLVLPAEADLEAVQRIAERYGRRLGANAEQRLNQALTADERGFFTNGNCDCGTMLAFKRLKQPADADEKETSRVRHAGWSETKLRRWREQKAAAATRKAA